MEMDSTMRGGIFQGEGDDHIKAGVDTLRPKPAD